MNIYDIILATQKGDFNVSDFFQDEPKTPEAPVSPMASMDAEQAQPKSIADIMESGADLPDAEDTDKEPEGSNFVAGMGAAWEGLKGIGYGARAAWNDLTGDEEEWQEATISRKAAELRAEDYSKGRITDYRQVKTTGDAVDYIVNLAGQAVPSLALSAVVGSIGGVLGLGGAAVGGAAAITRATPFLGKMLAKKIASGIPEAVARRQVLAEAGAAGAMFAQGYAMGVGDIYNETAGEDVGEKGNLVAAGFGALPYAALDIITEIGAIKRLTKANGGDGILKRWIKAVGGDSTKEGATESAQEATLMLAGLADGKEYTWEEALAALGNSFAGGFVAGAGIGGLSQAGQELRNVGEAPAVVDPEDRSDIAKILDVSTDDNGLIKVSDLPPDLRSRIKEERPDAIRPGGLFSPERIHRGVVDDMLAQDRASRTQNPLQDTSQQPDIEQQFGEMYDQAISAMEAAETPEQVDQALSDLLRSYESGAQQRTATQPEVAPQPEQEQVAEISKEKPVYPDVVRRGDGQPFSSAKAAASFAQSKGLGEWDIEPVDGGYELRAKVAQKPETAEDTIRQDMEIAAAETLADDAIETPPAAKPKPTGKVQLTHWGNTPGLTELSPEKWGTAAAGQEKNRQGTDFLPRTYYGLPGYRVEGVVAARSQNRYFTEIDAKDLYDIESDPDNLRQKVADKLEQVEVERQKQKGWRLQVSPTLNDIENEIKNAGYKGYYSASTNTAAVFDALPVREVTNEPMEIVGLAGYDERGSQTPPKKAPKPRLKSKPATVSPAKEDNEVSTGYQKPVTSEPAAKENVAREPNEAEQRLQPGQIERLLGEDDWTILTAENPAGEQATPEANKAAMDSLKADLDEMGLSYTEVIGKYGNLENSIFVSGITREQAKKLGSKYGQDSVLTSEGLIYPDGRKTTPVTGEVEEFVPTEEDDFYSTVPATGTSFRIGLDFGGMDQQTEKPRGLGVPKAAAQKVVDKAVAGIQILKDGKVKVHLLDSAEQLPEKQRESRRRKGTLNRTAGVYVPGADGTGDIYLILPRMDNLTQIVRTIYHEAGIHAGLRGIFSSPELDAVLRDVIKSFPQEVETKRVQYKLPDTEQARLIAAEEVLAEMGESNPKLGLVQRLFAVIKNLLRRTGIDLKLSDNDLQYIVSSVLKSSINGETRQARAIAKVHNTTGMSGPEMQEAGYSASEPVGYKPRQKPAPKKTRTVYKTFRQVNGQLYAMFVGATDPLPVGKWLDATEGGYHFTADNGIEYTPTKPGLGGGSTVSIKNVPNAQEIRDALIALGYLKPGSRTNSITAVAYRPGWHAGEYPFFPQSGMLAERFVEQGILPADYPYRNIHRENTVIAEVELDWDKDYKQEFEETAKRSKAGDIILKDSGLRYIPSGGGYEYATNQLTQQNDLGKWFISGSLKINRILTREEVNQRLADAGRQPQVWADEIGVEGSSRDKLVGIDIPESFVQEMKEAKKRKETIHDVSTERLKKRYEVFQKLYANGAAKKRRRVDIILGLPASGKSTVADPLVAKHGALLIDADEAKKLLPEFDNGKGAHAVHEESSLISKAILAYAKLNKDNIVYPVVGADEAKLRTLLDGFSAAGYTTHLHFVDLPVEKAVGRAIARYNHTGRLVPITNIEKAGNKPLNAFASIVRESYGHKTATYYDNDVARGAVPKPVAAQTAERVRNARVGRGGGRLLGAAVPANVPAQATRLTPLLLKSVPYRMKAIQSRLMGSLRGTKARLSVTEIGQMYDAEFAAEFGGPADYNDPVAMQRAKDMALAEVQYQLDTNRSGLDWYEDDVADAYAITMEIIPELADPKHQQMFSVVAGLQSIGTKAHRNWLAAVYTYRHFLDTGAIPPLNPLNGRMWEGQGGNKYDHLEMLNNIIKEKGFDGTLEFLFSTKQVRELNALRNKWGGYTSGMSGVGIKDYVQAIMMFGPKLGDFTRNLNGIHEDAVTVDLWYTRTIGRYFGRMIGSDGEINNSPSDLQRRVAEEISEYVANQLGIKPYQVQSVLWFFEQQSFKQLGAKVEDTSFSDGARLAIEKHRAGEQEWVEDDGGDFEDQADGSLDRLTDHVGEELSLDREQENWVQRKIENAAGWFDGHPEVTVVGTRDDLPFESRPGTRAAAWRGRVYIVASEFKNKNEARDAYAHEMVGHLKAEQVEGYAELLSDIGRESDRPGIVKEIWDREADKRPGATANELAREVIAVLAERQSRHPLIRRLVNAYRKLLKSLGAINPTEQRIYDLIEKAYREKNITYDNTPWLSVSTPGFDPGWAYRTTMYIIDDTEALKRAEKKSGITGVRQEVLLERSRVVYEVKEAIDEFMRPMELLRRKKGISVKQVSMFLHARHAVEANESLRKRNIERMKTVGALPDTVDATTPLSSIPALIQGPDAAYWRQLWDAPSGMTDANAAAILQEFHGDADMDMIGTYADRIGAERLRLMRESGILSNEQATALENAYEHYVPLFRVQGDEGVEDVLAVKRRGSGASRKPISLRKGSTKEVSDVYSNMITDFQRVILQASQNRVFNEFVKQARLIPDNGMFTYNETKEVVTLDAAGNIKTKDMLIQDPNYSLSGFVNGKRAYIVANKSDPLAVDTVRNFSRLSANANNAVIRFIGQIQRQVVSKVLTGMNFDFLFSNLTRDIGTALANVEGRSVGGVIGRAKMTGYWAKAFTQIFAKQFLDTWFGMKIRGGQMGEVLDIMSRTGGRMDWLEVFPSDPDKTFKAWQQVIRPRAYERGAGLGANTKLALGAGWRIVEQVFQPLGAASENAARAAAWKVTYDRLIASGMSIQEAENRASMISREVTADFLKRGTGTAGWNSLYLFFNPAIQSNVKAIQMIRQNKVKRLGVIGALIGTGALLAMMARGLSDDDDDDGILNIDEPTMEYRKDRAILIPIPKRMMTDRNGNQIIATIPVPYFYNIITATANVLAEIATGKIDAPGDDGGIKNPAYRAGFRIANIAIESLSPLGSPFTGGWTQMIAPTVGADQAVQAASNTTAFGAPLYPELNGPWDKRLPWERSYRSTPQVYKDFGKWLHEMTGGDEYDIGFLDEFSMELLTNPEVLQMIAEQFGGGFVQMATRLAKYGETGNLNDVTVLRRFAAAGDPSRDTTTKWFGVKERMEEVVDRKKVMSPERFAEWAADKPEVQIEMAWKNANKKVVKLRKEARELPEASPAREQKEDEVEQIMQDFIRVFVQTTS